MVQETDSQSEIAPVRNHELFSKERMAMSPIGRGSALTTVEVYLWKLYTSVVVG